MPVTRDPEDHDRIASAQLTQNDGHIPLPGFSRDEPTLHPGPGNGTRP